jgi:hypothetical protein
MTGPRMPSEWCIIITNEVFISDARLMGMESRAEVESYKTDGRTEYGLILDKVRASY